MSKRGIASHIVFWIRKVKEHTTEGSIEYARGKAVAYIDVAFYLNLINIDRWERLHTYVFDL